MDYAPSSEIANNLYFCAQLSGSLEENCFIILERKHKRRFSAAHYGGT